MGNKPVKNAPRPPPVEMPIESSFDLDAGNVSEFCKQWKSIYGVTPIDPCTVKPPPHCIEYMRLYGWLDLNLDDPDLAPLFK